MNMIARDLALIGQTRAALDRSNDWTAGYPSHNGEHSPDISDSTGNLATRGRSLNPHRDQGLRLIQALATWVQVTLNTEPTKIVQECIACKQANNPLAEFREARHRIGDKNQYHACDWHHDFWNRYQVIAAPSITRLWQAGLSVRHRDMLRLIKEVHPEAYDIYHKGTP